MVNNSKRTKKLLSETFIFAIGSFGSRILSMILVPFYTNFLTTAEYGTIDFISTIIMVVIPLFTLSIQDAVFLFAMDKKNDFRSVFSNSIVVLFGSTIFLSLAFPVIKSIFPMIKQYKILFYSLYISTAGIYILTYYLKATDRTKLFAIQGVFYTFCFSVLNIFGLAFFNLGIKGYLYSQIVANIICSLVMIFLGKLYIELGWKYLDFSLMVKMLKYSAPLIPASIAWFVMSAIDKYMLLNMCGLEANGLYCVANKLPSIITVFTSFFTNAWQIAAVRNKDELDAVEYASSIFNSLFSTGLILCILLVICSKYIGKIMFSNQFFEAWNMVPALSAATLFSTLSILIGAQFTAAKRSDLHLKSNIISLIMNVIFNYILIKNIGSIGAALGTMLSYYVVIIYRQIISSRLKMMQFDWKKNLIGTIILMASILVTGFEVSRYQIINMLLLLLIVNIFYYEYKKNISLILSIIKNKINKNI